MANVLDSGSDTESNRVLALSFWNAKEDAERYHREQYPKINEMLAPPRYYPCYSDLRRPRLDDP